MTKKITKKSATIGRKVDKIMQINVNSTRLTEVLAGVKDFISHNKKFYIVTPNPELVLMAQKDIDLKNALNGADLSIPDGVGLKIAIPKIQIIKGRKLFLDLIELASEEKWKVFLMGGLGKEAELASKELNGLYPELKISFDNGSKLNQEGEPVGNLNSKRQKNTIAKINKFAPDLLFVAFGNPKQEKWIAKNLSRLNIGGAMAVGGTFRYISGLSKLPPVWIEKVGLEWLWRGLTEPERMGRIFRAVVVFPIKFFLYTLLN